MNVAIILRRKSTPNVFRNLIIDTLGSGLGDRALLCSGFFQENFNNSYYRASTEGRLIENLLKYKIKLTTIGLHNSAWKDSYSVFCKVLNTVGVNISAKVVSSYGWHAKVYILFKDHDPFFGIIGSSNITKRAFGTDSKFNYECDVALWDDNVAPISTVVESVCARQTDPYQIVKTEYRPQDNQDISISNRLLSLANEILSIKGLKNL